MPLAERNEKLRGGAERDRDAFLLLEIQAADAQLRLELHYHARSAAGHEVHLPHVVLKPAFDLVCPLHRVAGRLGKAGEFVRALKTLPLAIGLAQRLLDLRAKLRRMAGQAADFLEHLKALRPELSLQQRIAQQGEEGVGLRALLGFAKGLGRSKEILDLRRITLQLIHPERLQPVEVLFFNQRIRIVGETHSRAAYCSQLMSSG